MLSYAIWGLVSLVAASWLFAASIIMLRRDKVFNPLTLAPYVVSGVLLLWWAAVSLLHVLQVDLPWLVDLALLLLFLVHAVLLTVGVWRSVR
ncbi:hypothetical protein MN202_07930 [Rheinheimera muenzenbergensis]|uniref:Uncharacterized protein n=1 Tax=Rheinheimera muenzenbergensis TaxID=1193628 RepID=A0ABU8C5G1_9GAMM